MLLLPRDSPAVPQPEILGRKDSYVVVRNVCPDTSASALLAVIQSLYQEQAVKDCVAEYGHIVVDEFTWTAVLAAPESNAEIAS